MSNGVEPLSLEAIFTILNRLASSPGDRLTDTEREALRRVVKMFPALDNLLPEIAAKARGEWSDEDLLDAIAHLEWFWPSRAMKEVYVRDPEEEGPDAEWYQTERNSES
jgi:hypothetical protein